MIVPFCLGRDETVQKEKVTLFVRIKDILTSNNDDKQWLQVGRR